MLDEKRLAYLAGFFDGEGSVGIQKYCRSRPWHTPYATVSQVRPDVLQQFKEAFGGTIYFNKSGGKNGIWTWQIKSHKLVLDFLKTLLPYLLVKRAEAEVVLEAFRESVAHKQAGTPARIFDLREASRLKVMGMR
jgi:hypothetical protein